MRTRFQMSGTAGWLSLLAASALVCPMASAITIEVTNTNDSGPGSLRDAINIANSNPQLRDHEIVFRIPGPGPPVIKPLAPLPLIVSAVMLTNDPRNPKVVLDGSMAGANNVSGLRIDNISAIPIAGSEVVIQGISIINFSGRALEMTDVEGLRAASVCIGIGATGETAPNGDGIVCENSSNLRFSGIVSSGNVGNGLTISGDSSDITVENSKFGTNEAGTADMGNGLSGVNITGPASNVTVKDSVVSGNGENGIRIAAGATGVSVENNRIGTNASGAADLGNDDSGVAIYSSTHNTVSNNVISGNDNFLLTSAGVLIYASDATDNLVYQNIVGLNSAGSAVLGNRTDGVAIFDAPGNLVIANTISGNGRHGLRVSNVNSIGNVASRNFIGTDVTGTLDLGNTGEGVFVGEGATDNIIGFRGALGAGAASKNLLLFSGELFDAGGNLISGNNDDGIEISSFTLGAVPSGNIVQGNLIGLNLSGTAALPNSGDGVQIGSGISFLVTSDNIVRLNAVSGNARHGVLLVNGANDNDIIGNLIGTTADGAAALGNGMRGISIEGGTAGGSGHEISQNVIANNVGNGVFIRDSVRNTLSGNAIFSNGSTGIDLFPTGVTANDTGDGDTGANNRQNFPVINSATTTGGVTVVIGDINSAADTPLTIEIFSNAQCDASGNGEGQFPVGSTMITTGGTGNASFNIQSAVVIPAGFFVSATATGPDGSTSEFSLCRQVTGDATSADLMVTKTHEPGVVAAGDELTSTITVHNNGPADAANVRMTDEIPAGSTFRSLTAPDGWTSQTPPAGSTGTVICDAALLASGAEASFTLVIKLANGVPGNTFITNRATAGSATPDPNPANNVGAAFSITSDLLSIKTIDKTEHTLEITVDSITGYIYRLQRSPSPASGLFIDIGSPRLGSTGQILTFTDSNATGIRGFYRVATVP